MAYIILVLRGTRQCQKHIRDAENSMTWFQREIFHLVLAVLHRISVPNIIVQGDPSVLRVYALSLSLCFTSQLSWHQAALVLEKNRLIWQQLLIIEPVFQVFYRVRPSKAQGRNSLLKIPRKCLRMLRIKKNDHDTPKYFLSPRIRNVLPISSDWW